MISVIKTGHVLNQFTITVTHINLITSDFLQPKKTYVMGLCGSHLENWWPIMFVINLASPKRDDNDTNLIKIT